ncbi:MAG TPA: cysteine synthase A [Chloroflexota bacterium]|nr:cysteine synthase A [Chloroflexota bacterium]
MTSGSIPTPVRWDRRSALAGTILETAGLTPLVALRRVLDGVDVELLVKVEYFGPSGSVKDRILPFMVAQAEARGELRAGMTIVEATTGNTGIATAMTAAARGYPAIVVMPEGMSDERKKTISAYGATLILTPGAESDVDLVLARVAELKAERPGELWEVSQFTNADNVAAHYATTGPEIWEQTGGKLDAFIDAQGTGGTLSGAGAFLREQDPAVQVFAIEPEECPILAGGGWGPHRIEGIGDGFIPDNLHLDVLDGVVEVSSDEAIGMARRLAREEGIFCGISSGCNVVGALKLARAQPDLRRIVTILSDNGLRYLSTELCGDVEDLDVPEREHPAADADREKLARHPLPVIR